MDIIGKRAVVTRVADTDVRGIGFIVELPEYIREEEYGNIYAVVYTSKPLGNVAGFCSFTELGKEEQGFIVELEED